jgi:simple sugar transport system permease protein
MQRFPDSKLVAADAPPAEASRVEGPETGSSAAGMLRRLTRAPAFGSVAAVVLIYVFFAAASAGNGFMTLTGTASWLDTASELGILAVPVALLMIAGEFDLSIGSMVAAGSITVGVVTSHFGAPVWVAVLIAMAIAVLVGLGNGLMVTRTGLPSFIVTLGANLILAGLALTISRSLAGTTTLSVTTSGFWHGLFAGHLGQFYISILWWLLLALAAAWILSRSRFGPWIRATGGNADQARRAGVLTGRVKLLLFVGTAVGAAFVGMTQAIQFGTADAVGGQGYVFQAPIVVVIGGVLLTGGFGTILGVVMGTVLYGIISGGLFYTGWDTDLSQVILGVLMIIAVLANNQLRALALTPVRARKRRPS